MIDFTNYKTKKKAYGGANGSKISISYNNEIYMIKLPVHSKKNANLSYTNSAVSEYLGCHIFNMLGITAQETILGKYTYHNVERIVVGCKDFVKPGYQLLDFASIKNQIIDSKSNGMGTELADVLETLEKQTVMDPAKLTKFFWEMFVVDALIGNWDRHNGNWGFLYDASLDEIEIAPIYDCGSCLYPQIDINLIKKVLVSKEEQDLRIYSIPTSALYIDGSRIKYYDLLSSHKYKELDDAIKEISKKVNLEKINVLIDSVEILEDAHKEFFKLMIKLRFEKLLLANIE